MKRTIKIIIGFVIIVIIGILIIIYNRLESKELVQLYSQKYTEKIYFIKLEWGNDERIIISQRNNTSVSNSNQENYVLNCGCCVLYGFKNDTLYLYGNNIISPKINKFKTPIKVLFIGNSDLKFKTFKENGLKMFPSFD